MKHMWHTILGSVHSGKILNFEAIKWAGYSVVSYDSSAVCAAVSNVWECASEPEAHHSRNPGWGTAGSRCCRRSPKSPHYGWHLLSQRPLWFLKYIQITEYRQRQCWSLGQANFKQKFDTFTRRIFWVRDSRRVDIPFSCAFYCSWFHIIWVFFVSTDG